MTVIRLQSEERVGRDGRTINTANIGRSTPPNSTEEATGKADPEDTFADEEGGGEAAPDATNGYADDDEVPQALSLRERSQRAVIVHDTLTQKEEEKPAPEAPSDEEWLESLPIYRVLRGKQHRAIVLRRALLDYRKAEKAIAAYARAIASAESVKAGDANFFARAFSAPRTITTPDNWGICPPCAGSGCTRCGQGGFEMGGGLDPRRVEADAAPETP